MTGRTRKFPALAITAAALLLAALANAGEGVKGDPAEAPCSPADRAAFEETLADPATEITPAYALERATLYLARCAGAPGSGDIARRAARSALDAGEASRAIELYEQARAYGASFSRADRLGLIGALVAEGEDRQAWSLRDDEIRRWLFELERSGFAGISETRLPGGTLIHVRYSAVDPVLQQREAWLAVPDDGGWPVAIVRGADQARVALRRLVAGRRAEAYEHLDLVRCHGRETLLQADQGFAGAELGHVAAEAAAAYLAEPDMTMSAAPGEPLPSCFDTHRLFVSPDPRTAVPAD